MLKLLRMCWYCISYLCRKTCYICCCMCCCKYDDNGNKSYHYMTIKERIKHDEKLIENYEKQILTLINARHVDNYNEQMKNLCKKKWEIEKRISFQKTCSGIGAFL